MNQNFETIFSFFQFFFFFLSVPTFKCRTVPSQGESTSAVALSPRRVSSHVSDHTGRACLTSLPCLLSSQLVHQGVNLLLHVEELLLRLLFGLVVHLAGELVES